MHKTSKNFTHKAYFHYFCYNQLWQRNWRIM